jgi:hypothetical protein
MKNIWEKIKAHKENLLVTIPNRYMGLILFLMLLAIYYR